MQGDLEVVLTKGSFFAEALAGFRGTAIIGDQKEFDLNLRNFYFGARDYWYAVRVGRFFPEFGIRHPNHNVPTRKGLFWNHNDEPYLAQASYLTETIDVSVGWLKGADSKSQLKEKEGYVYTVAYKTGHSRTGISVLDAGNSADRAKATSLFTLLGHEDEIYLLAEFAKKNEIKTDDRQTWLTSVEFGYEFTKGVIPYIGFESTAVSTSSSTGTTSEVVTRFFPLGVKFYPYTHFELIGQYSMGQQISTSGTDSIVMAFLMGNIYF